MTRRSRPSLQAKSKSSPGPFAKAGMVLGIICTLGVIGGIAGYGTFFSDKVEVDKSTGCPREGPIARHVMIVDQTDTFTPVQIVDIQNQFEGYKDKVPRYGELVIYAIRSGSNGGATSVLRVCNPGNAEDINQLVESSLQIARKWQEAFDGPMRRVIEQVLKPTSSDTSPIIETIQAVSVKEFGPTWMDGRAKKLIIISDFLQHSNALSHYRDLHKTEHFIGGQQFHKLTADLRDVDVDLLYLYRDTAKAKQNRVHRDFWIELIQKQGGSVRRIYSVSG